MNWFTSDTHAFHANIIKYCNRPFSSVEDMNNIMANNINNYVSTNDILWHLGDFAFGASNISKFREMINCRNINLILGNHDDYEKCRPFFNKIYPLYENKFEGQRITLCHYAMKVWNKSHHGSWHLYGHSHGSLPDDINNRSFDIGVDCHKFKPLNIEEIKVIMSLKHFLPIDHHTGER